MTRPETLRQFVVDSNGKIARPERRPRVSNIVGKWLAEGGPSWGPEARLGIERVERLWSASPVLGKLTASYGEHRGGGMIVHEVRFDSNAALELERLAGKFPAPHWRAFQAMVRDGEGAGAAARFLKLKPSQAGCALKEIVGLVATMLATA